MTRESRGKDSRGQGETREDKGRLESDKESLERQYSRELKGEPEIARLEWDLRS